MNPGRPLKIASFRQGSRNPASRDGRHCAGTALETGAWAIVWLPSMALDSGVQAGMTVMKPSCDCPDIMGRWLNIHVPPAYPLIGFCDISIHSAFIYPTSLRRSGGRGTCWPHRPHCVQGNAREEGVFTSPAMPAICGYSSHCPLHKEVLGHAWRFHFSA